MRWVNGGSYRLRRLKPDKEYVISFGDEAVVKIRSDRNGEIAFTHIVRKGVEKVKIFYDQR